uniref:Cuticular protein analogous to peritrophins 1-H n=1 Tax=Daphnia magna TaxID=35525 RepID=A0A0N8AXN4_9CRUS
MAFTFSFASAIMMVLGLALMVSCQEVKLEEVKSDVVEDVPANVVEGSTRPPLTGIPQIDYIWDPNLPPALNGYNLSNYPFYYKMPGRDEMNFECDNRLDGFYASVFHKCQVYHQCLFGQRYDFMCANFTAFDQKIFNCQFANEVDCDNSPLFYDRNEALYKEASTTPAPTPAPQVVVVRTRFVDETGREVPPPGRPQGGRFRRPQGKRRPVYYDDYYDYDYQEYYDAPANEEEDPAAAGNGTAKAKPSKAPIEEGVAAPVRPVKAGGGRQQQQQNKPNSGQGNKLNIFNNNRPPPRIRPPVPNSEGKKQQPVKTTTPSTTTALPAEDEYEYVDYVDGELGVEVVTTTTTTTQKPTTKRRVRRPKMSTTSTTTTSAPLVEEFIDDEVFLDEEIIEPVTTPAPRPRRPNGSLRGSGTRLSQSSTTSTTVASTSTTTLAPAIEEEPIQLPSKPNPSLFNRRTSVVNILKRRSSTTTAPSQDIFNEYDEIVDEVVDEAPPVTQATTVKTTTTTTTTPAPTRRTTRARPSRPLNTARARPTTEAPVVVVEEEAVATEAPVVVEVASPAPEEAPTTRAAVRSRLRSRPQASPVVEEEAVVTAAPAVRRGAQRRGPQPVSEVELDAQTDVIGTEENSRQGRDLIAPETSRVMLEESTNFDEDHGESQWSLIHLFSRVFPQRA